MTELTIRARHQAEQAYDPWERKHLARPVALHGRPPLHGIGPLSAAFG